MAIKEELKIKILTHELLASTLSYLMLTLGDTSILQISLYRLLLCKVWSYPASLFITGPTYYPAMNRCLRGPLLDMSFLFTGLYRIIILCVIILTIFLCSRSNLLKLPSLTGRLQLPTLQRRKPEGVSQETEPESGRGTTRRFF
jgi:hypothetical protein